MDIFEVKRRWESLLLRQPGVVGVGVSPPYIVVYVSEKKEEIVAGIPSLIEGFPVKIVEIGKPKIFLKTTDRWRPAPAGVSIGHPKISAGTFGGFVVKNGKIFGVSNNHVIALRWGTRRDGKIGDPVLQPGPYDGGEYPDDIIGYVKDYTTVESVGKNFIDFACFEPIERYTEKYILEIGEPIGVAEPEVGMNVKKFGRTSLLTHSRIEAVDVSVKVQGWGEATFYDQIAVQQPFSEPGDSGSLVLTEDNRVVGVLFAGSPRISIVNKASNIEKITGYRFVRFVPTREFIRKVGWIVLASFIGTSVSALVRRVM